MKRLALVAAILAVAACGKKDDAATMDTTSAMTPAPAAAPALDSAAGAHMDSASAHVDSAAKMVDSAKKAM